MLPASPDTLLARLAQALAGRFTLERQLGAGGMGTVYQARDERHGRHVAIKVLKPELASALGLERFQREIRLAAQLHHPHILALHDSGEADGLLYYVMPLVEGESLRDRLDRGGPLSPAEAIRIARDMADALAYAHRHGVLHRDIKPDNILLEGRHAFVADLGIARALQDSALAATLTTAGIAIGTPAYMAPEQALGERDIDQRADIYALGAVAFEMLAGRPPVHGDTPQTVMARKVVEPAPDIAVVRPDVPADLAALVRKALAPRREERWATADEILAQLDAMVTPSVGMAATAARRPAHARRAGLVAALAVLAVGAAVGARAWRIAQRGAPVTEPGALAVVPLLAGEGNEKHPAWSPAGDLIAYVSDEAGNDDIWLADRAGASRVNLTAAHPGEDAYPAWSPDGSRLAFYSDRDGPGIYVMSALGGEARRVVTVAPGVSYTFSLQWATDSAIVFTDFDSAGGKQVYRLPAGAGGPECLTCGRPPHTGQLGQVSPNGRLLLFKDAGLGPQSDLYVFPIRAGSARLIATLADHPRWDAAGRRVYFVSRRDGSAEMWALDVDAEDGAPVGEPRRLTAGLDVSDVAAGPAGTVLVVRSRRAASLWALPVDRARVDLAHGRQLTATDEFLDQRPRWSAALDRLIFESTRRGGFDVWSLAPGSGTPQRLTSDSLSETRPRPDPTGRWISFDVLTDRGYRVTLMRADGSERHQLPVGVGGDSSACCTDWSPDGRLAITLNRADALAIATVDADAGTVTDYRVTRPGGRAPSYPRWSPDGRFLAYEAFSAGSWDIWLADRDGGNARRLTTARGNERSPAWSPGSDEVYYTDLRTIYRLPLGPDGRPRREPTSWFVAEPRRSVPVDGMTFNRDTLYVSVAVEQSRIWLVRGP